ncbi:deoxynucleoside-5'-monophosphatase [Vibrio phage Ceto]|uniref:Deoxynucleoside-5'-monophosphatase n=1 Tax=Vibrio phage Ceto TaxID=2570300 RepID=A0A2H5BGB9_9CAUD|nr:deoxynucleoside-5'-monophosphatase [Vibrio phage Ceto]YP_009621283.1 deoxynucleoside-5'-monophosphatase [Vibrio phage Ceto]AUG85024.1 deoxynucleoside-5'-monophosphatase [Vibrio phage Ceto]AUG85202.1 deoxynucleoside-5'-monophosphatase [Vibrio phage Ceto]
MTKAYVFDLDGTTIDSFHRVAPCLDSNGNLNLDKYIKEACTPEKVANDTLLPLAGYMQQLIKDGQIVIILTARYMLNHDYVYLRKNQLRTPIICSRDQLSRVFGEGNAARISAMSDAPYKRQWFEHLFASMPHVTEWSFFDDHDGILEMANSLKGVTATDAKLMNELLQMQWADIYRQGEQDTAELIQDLIAECSTQDVICKPEWIDELLAQ